MDGGDFAKTPKVATERMSCLQAFLGTQPRPSSPSPAGLTVTAPGRAAVPPGDRRLGFRGARTEQVPAPPQPLLRGRGQRRRYPYSATGPHFHPHPGPPHGPIAQSCSPATDGEKQAGSTTKQEQFRSPVTRAGRKARVTGSRRAAPRQKSEKQAGSQILHSRKHPTPGKTTLCLPKSPVSANPWVTALLRLLLSQCQLMLGIPLSWLFHAAFFIIRSTAYNAVSFFF